MRVQLTPRQRVVRVLAQAWREHLAEHRLLNGLTVDDITRQTGLSMGRLAALLPQMERERTVTCTDPRLYPATILWRLSDRQAAENELVGGSGN